jgi:hypothetical protein
MVSGGFPGTKKKNILVSSFVVDVDSDQETQGSSTIGRKELLFGRSELVKVQKKNFSTNGLESAT